MANAKFKSDSSPIASAVGGEVGEVTSAFVSDGVTFVCVLFKEYGAEVSNIPADQLDITE